MIRMWRFTLLVVALLSTWVIPAQADECPVLLQGEVQKLRSEERIDLCAQFAGKPLVVVNTDSLFGLTPQFKGLEALYQRYKGQGLEVIGVPSDDFKQEAKTGEETAKVCYVNYGVTFTMTEPQKVKGDDAVHLFKVLAQQSSAPKWNFYKYLIDRDGNIVDSFNSLTKPDSKSITSEIEKLLKSKAS